MTEKRILSMSEVYNLAGDLAATIPNGSKLYPIPRGGIPVAYLLGNFGRTFLIVDDPREADFIVDDLIDSGTTMAKTLNSWAEPVPGRRFITGKEPPKPIVLLDKRKPEWNGKWIVFPWEGDSGASFEDNILRLLQFVGEDTNRGGLAETPARVAKAWEFWCSGYGRDPSELFKTFEDGAEKVDEMVLVKDIPFYTHCEHHMAPFFGTATVGYIPNGKVVGLSKINRLVDLFARRLQVQERLTTQVADAIMDGLDPKGVGVILQARHLCMESRGVCQQGHSTVTSALRGVMKEGLPRQEFLTLAR